LLDANSTQTLEGLAKVLNVGKLIVSDRLHAWESFEKKAKLLHELSKLIIKNCLIVCISLLSHYKKKFLYQIKKWAMKNLL